MCTSEAKSTISPSEIYKRKGLVGMAAGLQRFPMDEFGMQTGTLMVFSYTFLGMPISIQGKLIRLLT